MSNDLKIRWGWLKFMYIYTIVSAGGLGLGIIAAPSVMQSVFGWPDQDPVFFGVSGSVYLSFAVVSILGLRSPLKFSPILLLQLGYKVLWLIGFFIPVLIAGKVPAHAILLIVIFATYIIGDLIAIPFSYIFSKEPEKK